MRKVWLLLLLAPSALIYACGGDDSGNDGGSDAANDNTTKSDGSGDAATDGKNDTGTDTGPGDSGADVSLSITCLEPANCIDGGSLDASYPPDSGVVCCGTITGNGSQQCQIVSAGTACKAPTACATDFSGLLSCTSATVRFCNSNAECVETSSNPAKDGSKCCTANAGDGGTFKVCANSTIASASGGKIVCN